MPAAMPAPSIAATVLSLAIAMSPGNHPLAPPLVEAFRGEIHASELATLLADLEEVLGAAAGTLPGTGEVAAAEVVQHALAEWGRYDRSLTSSARIQLLQRLVRNQPVLWRLPRGDRTLLAFRSAAAATLRTARLNSPQITEAIDRVHLRQQQTLERLDEEYRVLRSRVLALPNQVNPSTRGQLLLSFRQLAGRVHQAIRAFVYGVWGELPPGARQEACGLTRDLLRRLRWVASRLAPTE